ncbi:MAG: hypothetical protein PHZ00_01200 [Candidatus Peribacteraceae bacterium]|nr:hypothetical protein [Candidatus Peribacteraceae bacterium]
MKVLNIILKVILCLLLVMPVLGSFGVFPPPTAEMYSPAGWEFMQALMATGYMMPLMGITFAVCLLLILFGRTPLAMIILAPLTVNIVFFHLIVDDSFFTLAASMAWVLLLLNAYFLWQSREAYRELW